VVAEEPSSSKLKPMRGTDSTPVKKKRNKKSVEKHKSTEKGEDAREKKRKRSEKKRKNEVKQETTTPRSLGRLKRQSVKERIIKE